MISETCALDPERLRAAIREEYSEVAHEPERGFHFHTGRSLAQRLGYLEEWLAAMPPAAVESFAGTGNPFALGALKGGERIVDVGSGSGLDSLIAARMVAPLGRVVGIDMTPAMIEKAERAASAASIRNVSFHLGFAESLPVESTSADVILSNGVLNLVLDKAAALAEMFRVLRPGGRLQIADILVTKPVPASAKQRIDLWTG
jgi:SAM-dependent methyltransferase